MRLGSSRNSEIYDLKKSIFQLNSKYVYEMMEGDLEIKDCEYDVGEVNLIN